MGNINSAYFKDMYEESAICADNSVASRPGTPLPTARHNRSSVKDPRSPSNCIPRTPIEVAVAWDVLDPRSPTYGIERTPIQIMKAVKSESTYLETNFDSADVCDVAEIAEDPDKLSTFSSSTVETVAEIAVDLDKLSTSSSPTVETVAAAIPGSASPMEDVLPAMTEVPQKKVAESLFKLTPENENVVSKDEKLIQVTETPPSHKGNRKLRNKENRVVKAPLIKADNQFVVPKVRTPLSTMSSHNNSPLQIVRGKQSRVLNQMQSTPPTSGEQVWQAIGN